jgi:hypothetical protein
MHQLAMYLLPHQREKGIVVVQTQIIVETHAELVEHLVEKNVFVQNLTKKLSVFVV